jgi:hypothetical protein
MYPLNWLLVLSGILLIIVGLTLSGNLGALGRLPGDIKIERPGFVFYFPLATSLIASLVLTVLLWLVQRLR